MYFLLVQMAVASGNGAQKSLDSFYRPGSNVGGQKGHWRAKLLLNDPSVRVAVGLAIIKLVPHAPGSVTFIRLPTSTNPV